MPEDTDAPIGAQTFEQMMDALSRVTPGLDSRMASLLDEFPELTAPDGSFMLGRIVGINLIDFICYAYGMPQKGFQGEFGFHD